mgnify:CR=1 FL=1
MIQLKAINLTDSYADKIAVKFGKYVDSLARKSKIVSNAHRVVNGEMPVFDNSVDSNFFLLRENSKYNAAGKIVNLVTDRIPSGYGLDSIRDIQVLCPSRKGEVGTDKFAFAGKA